VGLAGSGRPASAAPGWEIVLDRPTPNFGGTDFVSDNEGWMVAGAGLLHTTDGGATWTEAAALTGNDVDFADAQHGWLVGPSGAIYATTDGGVTWQAQSSGTRVHLSDVEAISSTEAWAVGRYEGFSDVILPPPVPSVLLHTADAGNSWQSIAPATNSSFRAIVFVGQHGWVLGERCEPQPGYTYCFYEPAPTSFIQRTEDGGRTWTLLEGLPQDLPGELTFVDTNDGWATGRHCVDRDDCARGIYGSSIYRTSDGGATWDGVDSSAYGTIEGLAIQDAQHGFALGSDCRTNPCVVNLLTTNDGGATWYQTMQTQSAAYAYGRSLALQAGTLYWTAWSGEAKRSLDGGLTWQPMEHPAISFDSKVDFVDKSVGYVISNGDLLRTDDAGRKWRSVGLVPDGARFFIRFITANLGFTSSRTCAAPGACQAKLWRTGDGGRGWQQVLAVNDEDAHFGDVQFADEQRGFASFTTGVAVTTDGGMTWEQHPAPDGWHLQGLAVADATNLWTILETIDYPNRYELRHSTDDGRTWQTIVTLPGYTSALLFVDRDHGWYADYTCADQCIAKLHATTDGGETWHEQDPGARALNDLVFVDPLNGWANVTSASQGYGEELLHTADGGETWDRQPFEAPTEAVAHDLDFVDARTGWFTVVSAQILGLGGGPPQRTILYHTTDAGGVPIGPPPVLPDLGAGSEHAAGTTAQLLLAAAGVLAITAALALRRRRL